MPGQTILANFLKEEGASQFSAGSKSKCRGTAFLSWKKTSSNDWWSSSKPEPWHQSVQSWTSRGGVPLLTLTDPTASMTTKLAQQNGYWMAKRFEPKRIYICKAKSFLGILVHIIVLMFLINFSFFPNILLYPPHGVFFLAFPIFYFWLFSFYSSSFSSPLSAQKKNVLHIIP